LTSALHVLDGRWAVCRLDAAVPPAWFALDAPLAAAGVPVFALATYDTDVVLVPAARLDDARAALHDAGHSVR
jgi:hypothetical protein